MCEAGQNDIDGGVPCLYRGISPKRTWFSSTTRLAGGYQLFREKPNPYCSKYSLSPNFSVAHCIPLRKATNYEAIYSLTVKTSHGNFSVYNAAI